ncbi:MAG: hypothetical protein ABH828_01075 [archaeon]
MKEEKNLSYHEIAILLNRDDRTIWTAYSRVQKKRRTTEAASYSKAQKLKIPSTIFRDRSLAVLEAAVEYLKDEKKLSYHEIAQALNRDDRTIWTVYYRAKQKRRNNEKAE